MSDNDTATARGRVLELLDQDEMTEDGLHAFTCDQYDALWAAVEADRALFADAVGGLSFVESMLSPNMSDQRCAEFGDWRKEKDGDERYAGIEGRRCGECMGCVRWFAWANAREVLARIEAARSTTEDA